MSRKGKKAGAERFSSTIMDGENSVSGEIVDMTLFHILTKDNDNNLVSLSE